MSKKVLIFSSSPRKGGNSDLLCDQFALGAQESGNEVEKISLRDKKINFCHGCMACMKTGKCVQKDDMAEILDKMLKADILVFATPVYFYTMSAQLKVLIDRTVAKYTEIRNKKAYLIAASGENDESAMNGTINAFHCFLSCLNNVKDAGHIFITGVNGIGEATGSSAAKKAYETGKNI